jgi:hypothetical protein
VVRVGSAKPRNKAIQSKTAAYFANSEKRKRASGREPTSISDSEPGHFLKIG